MYRSIYLVKSQMHILYLYVYLYSLWKNSSILNKKLGQRNLPSFVLKQNYNYWLKIFCRKFQVSALFNFGKFFDLTSVTYYNIIGNAMRLKIDENAANCVFVILIFFGKYFKYQFVKVEKKPYYVEHK